jgi:Cytochrome P460
MQRTNGNVQQAVWNVSASGVILLRMMKKTTPLVIVLAALSFVVAFQYPAVPTAPQYVNDKEMKFPENYRDWTYLTTGFDMSYNPAMRMGHHMFDNVFVNPEAYKSFVETGTWPDKTIFVLEGRMAKDKGSINKAGQFQSTEIMGMEVHVKDTARFPGGWAFFGSEDGKTAKIVPQTASCYSCHADHAAVDTTFVQFYPTLLPVAEAKKTLSPGYLKDIASEAKVEKPHEPAK